jgi:hypothetical protein
VERLDATSVEPFVASLPEFSHDLAGYAQCGNTEITDALDDWLDRAAVGVA